LVDPAFVNEHFIPLALDTYFRGNSHEVEFCKAAGAGGNHLVAVTANGKRLGEGKGHRGHVLLRERDLAPLLVEFRALPKNDRKPTLPAPKSATPPKRPVPDPPEGGLIIRGYCTYMQAGEAGRPERAERRYYQQNPDAWTAETQSDMLWLTEDERLSLVPEKPEPGDELDVPDEIQRRFFSTIGIDYMEGSVNALPVRESRMTIKVVHRDPDTDLTTLRIEGFGKMGKPHDASSKGDARTRGCELQLTGRIIYDRVNNEITAFDLAGVGEAWGNKMEYTRREIGLPGPRWMYGIACELVPGDRPYDLIPPYNMLHYGGKMKYFTEE
jgi:hypothetical protein